MLYLYKGYNKRKRKTTFLFCAPALSSQKAQDSYYKMHKTISPKITKGTECIFSFLRYHSKSTLFMIIGLCPIDQNPTIYRCEELMFTPFLSFIFCKSTTIFRDEPKSYEAGSVQ